jgi:uncharacterized hydrophobic protein (TIGR00341 family)
MVEKKGFLAKVKQYFGFEMEPERGEETADAPPAVEEIKEKKEQHEGEEEGPRKIKDRISEQRQEVRELFDHVIQPEERTLSNYMSMKFWQEKRGAYRKIKEKEKEDLNVFSVLSEGARPTIEYYILTILSCVIATSGLIVGSTAIIIGAMIVAPLMTPILAFSLGVIWGDLKLMRTSLESILKGAAVAILIAVFITLFVPETPYSPEILSRTKPSLYDIIVAIASGLVGAYGYANKKISSALVGIAIAVALMPPLCTIGIGLGNFDMEVALGAATLFIINLVSMLLAGAIVFWGMKIHPIKADQEEVKRRALFEIVLALTLLVAITIPVSIYMVETYTMGKAKGEATKILLEELPGTSIYDMRIEKQDDGYLLELTIIGDVAPDRSDLEDIVERISLDCGCIDTVIVRFIESKVLVE